MARIVQKYGGSSVATAERIQAVAARLIAARDAGNDVIVVVSAMGDTTDELIALARQVTRAPGGRDLDLLLSTGEIVSSTLLSMCLRDLGHDAVALTGQQAGIRTDSFYSRARIVDIDPSRMEQELEQGRIVIVAGFQGVTPDLDVTTLGRGGSDTTAVAIAIALKAAACEIYTDVDGIYTADPRMIPTARKLSHIAHEEMVELAKLGARVMHARAVELAELFDMPIVVRSSFNNESGTVITRGEEMENQAQRIRGIAVDTDVAKISVLGIPDRPGVAHGLFQPLADDGINVDVIVQNISHDGITDISFTVSRDDLAKTLELMEGASQALGVADVLHFANLAKVSSVGTGIQSTPGVAARMFGALAEPGINIESITTSEIRITCLVHEDDAKRAARALHHAFELDQPEE